MEQSGANVSGQLLRLGNNGSGSGSGVVPNYGMGSHPSGVSGNFQNSMPSASASHMGGAGGSQMMQPAPAAKGNNTLLIVIAIGFFAIAGLLIVLLVPRYAQRKNNDVATADGTGSPAVTGVAVGNGTAGTATGAPGDTAANGNTTPPPGTDTATPPPPPTGATASATAATTAVTTKGGRPPATAAPPKTVTATHPTPPPPPPPAEDKDPGFLTINVYPWAKVSEGGRVLCAATPCNKVPLSPGSHTLTLENPEQGMKQSISVAIKSGETTTRAIGLK
jgi:serine/threonine-protein kinase